MKTIPFIINVRLTALVLMVGVIFALAGCQASISKESGQKQKPNIVLIVADDLGYGDISTNGATKISTPSIDELAENGMNFSNVHVVSSICSPSRYSFLTGRYSWRTRLKHGVLKYYERPLIEDGETTLGTLLQRNGYRTACVGKWHLGLDWALKENAPKNPEQTVFNSWENGLDQYIDFSKPIKNGPNERGFDYFYGMAGSNNMQPYVYIENNMVVQPPSIKDEAYDHYNAANRAPNWDIRTLNQDFTNKAVKVINDHFQAKTEAPLFLYFPTSAIHRPALPTMTRGQSTAGLRGDIVEELDWTVSEIVKALKENGVLENTLIIFTSDNGPRPGDPALWMRLYEERNEKNIHQEYFDDVEPAYVNENGNKIWKEGWFTYGHNASGDMRGFKSDAWQGALKVPFIVHWPKQVKSAQTNQAYLSSSDLFATLADVVGDELSSEEGQDSYSFLENLYDPKVPTIRQSLTLTGGASGAFTVIEDEWKYIEPSVKGRWPETYYPDGPSNFEPQLYNLKNDPGETRNLHEEMPKKVEELKTILSNVQAYSKAEATPKNLKK